MKAGMHNGMEYGMEHEMEWDMEWGNVEKYDKKHAVVLCICCQQVADTLPYTEQTKNRPVCSFKIGGFKLENFAELIFIYSLKCINKYVLHPIITVRLSGKCVFVACLYIASPGKYIV